MRRWVIRTFEKENAYSAFNVAHSSLYGFLYCVAKEKAEVPLQEAFKECAYHLNVEKEITEGIGDVEVAGGLRLRFRQLREASERGDIRSALNWVAELYNILHLYVPDRDSKSVMWKYGVHFDFLNDYEELHKEGVLFPIQLQDTVNDWAKVSIYFSLHHPKYKPLGYVELWLYLPENTEKTVMRRIGEVVGEVFADRMSEVKDYNVFANETFSRVEIGFECLGRDCAKVRKACIEFGKKIEEFKPPAFNPAIEAVFQDCERLVGD